MSARRDPTPSYLPHKQSSRAHAVWTDQFGKCHQKLMPGAYDRPESRTWDTRISTTADRTGSRPGEIQHIKVVCRHARELYSYTLASEFGPLALKAVRERFIAVSWCHKSVNQQVERVRRAFKWATGEELIPPEGFHWLTTVERGCSRSNAALASTASSANTWPHSPNPLFEVSTLHRPITGPVHAAGTRSLL